VPESTASNKHVKKKVPSSKFVRLAVGENKVQESCLEAEGLTGKRCQKREFVLSNEPCMIGKTRVSNKEKKSRSSPIKTLIVIDSRPVKQKKR